MNRNKTLKLANAGMIAALYVVLTVLAAQFNLANGAIQVRFSEALTILPVFTAASDRNADPCFRYAGELENPTQ